jgi:hypothetical protein
VKLTKLTQPRQRPSTLPVDRVSGPVPAMFALPAAAPEGPVARALTMSRRGVWALLPVGLVAGLRVTCGHGISGSTNRSITGAGAAGNIQFIGDVRGVPPRGRPA